MKTTRPSNVRSPSPAVAGITYTLKASPPPLGGTARRRRTFPQFLARNPRKALWIKVHFVGGGTGKWCLELRGEKLFLDHGSALGDVLWGVNGW